MNENQETPDNEQSTEEAAPLAGQPASGPADETNTLDAIAQKINAAHQSANALTAQALVKRREVGELLVKAKKAAGRGRWRPWVDAHCAFDIRQAQKYMLLVDLLKRTSPLGNANCNSHLAQLSLEEAIKQLKRSLNGGSKSGKKTRKPTSKKPRASKRKRRLPVASGAAGSAASGVPLTYSPYADSAKPMLLWTVSEQNGKTGPMLTSYVGPTLKHTMGSCVGCDLFPRRCYAWNTRQRAVATRVMKKAAADLPYYSLAQALHRYEKFLVLADRKDRVARLCALGDPARVEHRELRFAIESLLLRGFTVVGYTHHWRKAKNKWLSSYLMASCNTEAEFAEARSLGWRPTLVHPSGSPMPKTLTVAGENALVCPAQRKPGSITCSTCRLCDPQHEVWKAGKVQGVVFFEHGTHLLPGRQSRSGPAKAA